MKNKSIIFVFDLGRVLLNIDPIKCYECFLSLGISKEYESRLKELFQEYESGQLHESQLLDIVNEETNSSYDYEAFWCCWDQMIIGFIPEMIDRLERLKEDYTCVLLSNTNSRHQKVFEELFMNTFGYPMSEAFDALFYSHQMSCSKPSSEIYHMVENKIKVDNSRFYFFDDLKDNLNSANGLGWNIYHVTPDVTATLEYIELLIQEF
ncbi:HAD-IA family hydrolase [Halosquirtibacter xylanolyticus]|uniref:HAD-IA family hydrolase n=1 Tax=Halosquirtibacter xylanolyticus TaxID=3374599 RepID=UPI0037488C7D|nr:HAD-IA family hydrolase [Prolixibacteraceae bacterium]